MSRIPSKPTSDYPWYLRLLFHFQKKKYGAILDPILLWGRTPRVFMGFLLMQNALNRKSSHLSPLLRALITVKVSQINQCAFCVDMNSFLVLQRGGSKDKLNALSKFREDPTFTECEKVTLEYCETITLSSQSVSDNLFQNLKVHYNEDEIAELTALIAFQNLSSKFNSALEATAFGFCKKNK